ncbi:MAG: thiamine pyrophosphate-binding protein [Thermofilaceae archaeon]
MGKSLEERVATILVRFLNKWGVKHAFVYAGHTDLPLLYSIKYESDITGIVTRREDQAVFMADAYWRMKRSPPPSIVVVTTGPGVANTIPALANAFFDSSALILLAGITPTHWTDKGRLEETYRYAPEHWVDIMKPITKRAIYVNRPELALEMLARAANVSVNGRPGPVSMHIPVDIKYHKIETEKIWIEPDQAIKTPKIAPDPEVVSKTADIIIRAERPVILAGGGVHNAQAWDELRTLAEAFNIPVATTFMGKGAIPEDHPLSLGVAGICGTGHATKAVREADVLIAIGARFSEMNTIGYQLYEIPKETKLIHIDIDPIEIGRVYPPEVAIISDAKLALRALNEALVSRIGKRPIGSDTWLGKLKEYLIEWENSVKDLKGSSTSPLHYARVFHDASEVIAEVDRQTSVLFDTGLTHSFAPAFWKAYSRFVSTNGHWAQMGFATAGIIGAKLANPEHPAVAVTGDGSFFMVLYSLATAYEYDIPAVWIVMDNAAVLIETLLMQDFLGKEAYTIYMKEKTKTPWNPDIVKLAEAMGCRATRIAKPEEFKPAVKEALKSGEPYVVDVLTAHVPGYFAGPYLKLHPWPLPTSFYTS